MAIRAWLHRWRWLLLAAAILLLLAGASAFVTLPLRDGDKAQAARDLVAWIIDGRSVPGLDENYPDAQSMPTRKQFFVICQGFEEALVLKGGGIGQPSDPPGGESYFNPILQSG
jgi:hypothetical protein